MELSPVRKKKSLNKYPSGKPERRAHDHRNHHAWERAKGTSKCPCCCREMPGVAPLAAVIAAQPSPIMAGILAALASRAPMGAQKLASVIYADRPDGGPDFADVTVRKVICLHRAALRDYGWDIVTTPGVGYRLVPIA